MSRPYKEVIFYDNLSLVSGASTGVAGHLGLSNLTNSVRFGSNSTGIYKLWGGSIQQFIDDFELPQDFINYWKTKSTNNTDNAIEVYNPDRNTINFKVNLQFWYRLDNNDNPTNFAPCSNLTFPITLPNFLSYNYAILGFPTQGYAYNPNIFPIIFSNSSFITSNKETGTGYNGQSWGGLGGGVPFLVFRYNVDGQDIQICLVNIGNSVWDKNNTQIYLARASLTFTGFNSAKKVSRNVYNE